MAMPIPTEAGPEVRPGASSSTKTNGMPTASGSVAVPRRALASTWIILANVAVYAVNMFTMQVVQTPQGNLKTSGLLFALGNFNFNQTILQGQVWRFITFQFLHNPHGLMHLGFNMAMLWMIAPVVEEKMRAARFVVFYLACGMAGPIMLMLLNRLGVLIDPGWTSQPLVGASAGVFGVLVAAAIVAPNEEIELIFPPIPMLLRQFVMIMIAVACAVVFGAGYQAQRNNAGGEAAHLGGAAVGYLLARRMLAPRVFNAPAQPR